MKLVPLLALAILSLSTYKCAHISYSTSTILTICDMDSITKTHGQHVPPVCHGLEPIYSYDDFFYGTKKNRVWDTPCEDTTNDEPESRRPTIWDRSVRTLHGILTKVQNGVDEFIKFILTDTVANVTRASLITKRWDMSLFIVLSSFVSLVLFIQGVPISRAGSIFMNVAMNGVVGFVFTGTFYGIHLYFQSVYAMAPFALFALFALSPFYTKTCFSAFGAVVLIELVIPLLGFILKLYFQTNLFFGPVLSLVINLGSLLVQILCFIALYVDEKLTLVKVFLLPFYQMCVNVFSTSKKGGNIVNNFENRAVHLTHDIFATLGDSPPDDMGSMAKLDMAFTQAIQNACKSRTNHFLSSCYPFIRDQCKNTAWNLGWWQYAISLTVCPSAATQACEAARNKAKGADFCVLGKSAFGETFQALKDGMYDLYRQIIIDPLEPNVNSDVMEFATVGFDLFEAKPTWWLQNIISIVTVALALAVVIGAVTMAFAFLYKYFTDVYFCNNYLSKSKMEEWDVDLLRREKLRYYGSFGQLLYDYLVIMIKFPSRFAESLKPLMLTWICFTVEKVAYRVHLALESIDFVVPEYGDARFVFNVQGTGFLASIIRAVLGGFTLNSKYCKIADSSVCSTAFIPVGWKEWMFLCSVAIFYLIIGLYQSKSDYIMCRICDFLVPSRGEERATVVIEDLLENRRKRAVVVNALAEEEMAEPVFSRQENESIIAFYVPRRWYHRFVPNLGLSLIAWCKYGISSILCQVCGQDIVVARFGCRNLLFCEECQTLLDKCPCGSDLCADRVKYDV